MNYSFARLKFSSKWALRHLLGSAVIVALVAAFVFGFLYPNPWRNMLGVGAVFALVVSADLVCGPLLTLVLASPKKSLRERWLDLSLVILIQLAALAYGLWTVYSARPVVLAFEVDRLVVITANEVQIDQLPEAMEQFQKLPITGQHKVSLRSARSSEEFLQSVVQSIEGVTKRCGPVGGDHSTRLFRPS